MGKYFGVPDEALCENGEIPMQALHPDDVKKTFDHFRLCGVQGVGWNLEYRVVINQQIRWHRSTTNIAETKNTDGSVTWNGYLSDITDAKERELQLAERNQLLQQVTKTIPGVMCQYVIEPDGSVNIP